MILTNLMHGLMILFAIVAGILFLFLPTIIGYGAKNFGWWVVIVAQVLWIGFVVWSTFK
jgi:hypothetical protein